MTVIEDIKQRIDLVDTVSQTVKLKRSGKNYTGFCPFHSNTRTPAFVVFPETQTWRCFGQCNEGGDLFGYVMKRDNLDFQEALKQLADRAGVVLKPQTPADIRQDQVRQTLTEVMESAQQYFRKQMLETEKGRKALDYLHQRKLTDETIKIWGLGYAPDSWNLLLDHLLAKGYTRDLILKAGLLSQGEDGRVYDRFRDRLIFPIRNPYRKMAGFGGRVLNPDDIPKYLNSPATDVFDKGRLLYGLDLARAGMRKLDQAVIVEGYMDVIGLHQAGFDNAVSPMGTALTEAQFNLVKKITTNIVLALDPDAAGQMATMRGLDTARKAMDRSEELTINSRGLLQIERSLKADIRVTELPDGLDPDEIVLDAPERWQKILSEAKPIINYVMDSLAVGQDLSDPKVKREIADQVLPLLEDVASPIERDAYRLRLATLLRLDERTLVLTTNQVMRERSRNKRQELEKSPVASAIVSLARRNRPLEEFTLKHLLAEPESLYMINRSLVGFGLSELSRADFQDGDYQHLFDLLKQSLGQDEYEAIDYLELKTPEIVEIINLPEKPAGVQSENYVRSFKDRLRTILHIRRNNIEDRLREIYYLQNESEEKTYTSSEANVLYMDLIEERRKIDEALVLPETGGAGRGRNVPGVYRKKRR
ncbi:MAG: DNA primase [Chloroflexi bacterium]|nr:DNA primase [Chloroflexota bacterium]